MILKYNHIAF